MKIQLLILCCCFMFISCKKKNTEEHVEYISVEVDTVRMGTLTNSQVIKAVGMVVASEEIRLAFKLGGKIKKIYVEEGDFVRKGEICATLDIKDVETAKSQAKLVLDKNERDLSRIKSLYADSAATHEQYQNMQTAYDLSVEQYNIALEHEVQTQIFAPFDGVVAKKMADEGEMISPFNPLFLFQGQSDSDWKVKVGVSDKEVVNIKLNDVAKVEIDAFNDFYLDGKVSNIGIIPNTRSGLYPVEIKLAPTTKRIFSGFTATVFLYPSDSLMMTYIPIGALVDGNNKDGFVFVIDEKSKIALRRKVRIKDIAEGCIYVNGGLKEGELIVSKGVSFLSDSTQVKIANNNTSL